MKDEILLQAAGSFGTPCYIFDADIFAARADAVARAFGGAGLCFSIKANPFLLNALPDTFDRIEVCSPGELSVCKNAAIPAEKIIFSGVNKTEADIECAFDYGAGIFTAESELHLRLISECAQRHNTRVKVILRLAHGSQFGIDRDELCGLIAGRDNYLGADIIGLHYFTGTQKSKVKTIEKELALLDELCEELAEKYAFEPKHIEYGTGLAVEYYKDLTDGTDMSLLEEAAVPVRAFAEKYPLTVEMGRFFAAECGFYLTRAMDIKRTDGTNYVICDGGINQLNYYGQNLAMKVPPIRRLGGGEPSEDYCLCGSLCTTADVLVRKVGLPHLERGDVICFGRCGAYSVSEGISLFLSRALPAVAIYSEDHGLRLQRPVTDTWQLNTRMNGGI